jgi:uncharacterized protein DUF6484
MMKQPNHVEELEEDGAVAELEATDLLLPLMRRQSANGLTPSRPLVAVGELIALKDDGRTPLVLYPGQKGSAAVPARSTVDLQGSHIGRHVVLLFESNEDAAPIVMGVLREGGGWPAGEQPGQVEVQADGERMIVSARKQLVLRCGKARITLTEEGKVLVEGTYVSSRSSGLHRIKGGCVLIN